MPDENGTPHPIEKMNRGLREHPQTGVNSDKYRENIEKIFPDYKPWYVRRDEK